MKHAAIPATPPMDLQLERAVLGAAFTSADVARTVAALPASLFYNDGHRDVHAALARLAPSLNGAPPDVVLVGVETEKDGRQVDHVLLASLIEEGGVPSLVPRYVTSLRDLARRRELWSAALIVRGASAPDDSNAWQRAQEHLARADQLEHASLQEREPTLIRAGLDLSLAWPDGVHFALTSIRDGREGVRGELTVTKGARKLHWGSFSLASSHTREALRKKLESLAAGPQWGEYLEEACFRLTQAAREGEPLVTLTGATTSSTRELLPGLLYEGEPTLLFGDGDTGKSLVAVTLAVAMQSGARLPFGLRPARPVPAAILDYETSRDPVDARAGLVSAGIGVDTPPILYKRMTRPLVDQAGALAAEFADRGIRFVVIDSMMFAVAGGDGAMVHEPITAFYNALRLFAPAAVLVLSHVTGADARGSGPKRPYGGAFAFNGPRLIWEASRDKDVTDATAIAFTCTKANNFARRPEPFGLRFQPGDGTITVYPFNLAEAAPHVVGGASVTFRLRLALARGIDTPDALAEELSKDHQTIKRLLRRLREQGKAKARPDGSWELVGA